MKLSKIKQWTISCVVKRYKKKCDDWIHNWPDRLTWCQSLVISNLYFSMSEEFVGYGTGEDDASQHDDSSGLGQMSERVQGIHR